ncbi:N-acetylmuramoyl-L-alanine amidase [Actinoplanes sp. LDG1-06]|uniref:N-acetylmuramoyl-L-alanine amidase n=1 Tax=Paractinoplanes ovalisporus TaxID=2810368 RepID=A0ABS2AK56_9ACTN|nr:N-acetylmuramoyl-L-alanine amidase [Actinoplanes ovalisporus]MBM2620200.1 N-acetylmuramoyl-L-alanine amidase [Actinoplanes ovalisporus]
MGRRLVIGVGAAVAVLAAGGGVAVLTWPSSAAPASLPETIASVPAAPAASAPGSAPAKPAGRTTLNALDLTRLGSSRTLPPRTTKRFSLVSVNWTSPKDKPAGTVQVRTRNAANGAWSGWQSLKVAEAAVDQPGELAQLRGRTEPIWAGPSDGVAVRVSGSAALPAGLRLKLIDPDNPTSGGVGGGVPLAVPTSAGPTVDTSPPPPAQPEEQATTGPTTAAPTVPAPTTKAPAGPAPIKAAAMPAIVSRAGWGADEKSVKAPPAIAADGVKMVFVHHTAVKQVPCAQSASQIRSIMANDIDDGFDDLGYNFVVDQCGTVFEGRGGGVTKAVVGAHVAGFNTGSVGIALLGDYTSVRPTQIALTKIAELAAARLAAYGNDASGSVEMTAGVAGKWPLGTKVMLPRLSGHRDAAQTACPGNSMYPLMGVIRARALLPGLAITGLTGGPLVSATGSYYVRTTARLSWNLGGDLGNVGRYDILLDNQVTRTLTGNVERSTDVDIPVGAHTLAVRVVHATGAADVTPSIKVFGDRSAPTFPAAPAVALRTGTYSTTAVPVTVTFRSADNVKVFAQKVTSPAAVALGATSTVWYPTVKPGTPVTYTVEARDWAGNIGKGSLVKTITQMPETSAKATGTWSPRVASTYLGGRALAASAKNAKLAYTFTGRSAALTFTRTSATGVASVYVDGVKVATVDTKASGTVHRQTLWVRALTAKTHTVSVVVAGTSGRPTVISDGLTYVP